MTTLVARLRLQSERRLFINSLSEESESEFFKTLPISVLQTKLELLENHWKLFEQTHFILADRTDEEAEVHDYFKENHYRSTLTDYALARSALITRHDELFFQNEVRKAQLKASPPQPMRRSLPQMGLPHFAGESSGWRTFRDLFRAMVIANDEITDVEKLYYLQSSLSGEAARITSNLPLSSDSFRTAWDLLVSRYDNPRLLINSHLDQLFGDHSVIAHSSTALHSLLNSTTESLNALRTLEAPVHHWDLVLVYHLVKRLDQRTREAWEVTLGPSTAAPTFDQLSTFLIGRARALENIELSNRSPPRTTGSTTRAKSTAPSYAKTTAAKIHVVTSPTRSSATPTRSRSHPCSFCDSLAHYVVGCTKFRALTPIDRRTFITEERLCYNCLGWHHVNNCQSVKRCQKCSQHHHTLLHVDSRDPIDSPASTSRTSTPSTSTRETRISTPPPTTSPEKRETPPPRRASSPRNSDTTSEH